MLAGQAAGDVSMEQTDPLSVLLQKAQAGDQAARDKLFAIAYDELRSQARAQLRNGGRNTFLSTTVLVHESFLRFQQAGHLNGGDRGHFFSYAAQVMRSVIVDFARKRQAERRGGDVQHISLDTQVAGEVRASDDELMQMDEALQTLEATDSRLVRVVEMRFFVGMTEAQIAETLGVTDRTVRRDWEKAKLLLSVSLRR